MTLIADKGATYGSITCGPGLGSSHVGHLVSLETEPLLIPVGELDPSPSWAPMTKKELEQVAREPGWRKLRSCLIVLFWVSWLSILVSAVSIIALSRRPVAPSLKWWQKAPLYQEQSALLLRSDQVQTGADSGVHIHLQYLRSLGVGALIVEGFFSQDLTPLDLWQHNSSLDSLSQLQHILTEGNKAGLRILLDLCGLDLSDFSSTHLGNETGMSKNSTGLHALRFLLDQGVAGFSICDTDAAYSESTLILWRVLLKEFSQEDNERYCSGSSHGPVQVFRDHTIGLGNSVDDFTSGLCVSKQNVVGKTHKTYNMSAHHWQSAQYPDHRIVIVRQLVEMESRHGAPSPRVNHSLVEILTRSLRSPPMRPLSAKEVAVAIETSLLKAQEEWPSWTLGGAVSWDLHRILMVLAMALPGPPVISYNKELGYSPSQKMTRKETLKLFHTLSFLRLKEGALLFGNFSFFPPSTALNFSSTSMAPSLPVLAFLRTWGCTHFLILLNLSQDVRCLDPSWASGLPASGVFAASTGLDRSGVTTLDSLLLNPEEAVIVRLFDSRTFS